MKSGIYSTSLTLLLPFLISQSTIALDGTDIVDVENELAYPDIDDIDDTGLEKRRSRFMRIGRGLSSFIRIGKNGVYAPVDGLYDDVDDDGYDNEDNGQLNGASGKGYANKRLRSFVHIGRGMGYPREAEKRAGAFIRVGKFPSSGYYRSQYSGNVSPYYRRTGRIGHSSFIRIGKRDTSNTLNDQKTRDDLYKRYMELERQYGGDDSDMTSKEKKLSRFVRIGRPSRFVRIGRRPSSFVRIGKSSNNDGISEDDASFSYNDGLVGEDQKRMSKFVRIGKNKELLNDDIFKRRLSNFVRIGRQSYLNDLSGDEVKRRMSSFVRIWRQPDLNEVTDINDSDNGENVKRRMSSFARIGKSLSPEENIDDVKRRMSSFVRIGKSVDTEGKENGLALENDMKEQNEAGLQ